MHGMLEFMNRNSNSENSKILKVYEILREMKLNLENTKEKIELAIAILDKDSKENVNEFSRQHNQNIGKNLPGKLK